MTTSAQIAPPAKPFALKAAIATFLLLECLVLFQAVSAYQDQFATVAQMQSRGVPQGLPFIWHFAMWGDVFLISPMAAYIVGRFLHVWQFRTVLISFSVGLVIAGVMSWLYTQGSIPEAHVHDHRLTAAGVCHALYMAISLSILTEFFFFTSDVSRRLLLVVSILLVIHVFYGTHMMLGLR